MQNHKIIRFHRRADMALAGFMPGTRERVEQTLETLADPRGGAEDLHVRRISEAEPIYILRMAPQIRIIFAETAAGFEVQDVVRKDTLESFAQHDF